MVPTYFQATRIFIPRASSFNCYDYPNWYKNHGLFLYKERKLPLTVKCAIYLYLVKRVILSSVCGF